MLSTAHRSRQEYPPAGLPLSAISNLVPWSTSSSSFSFDLSFSSAASHSVCSLLLCLPSIFCPLLNTSSPRCHQFGCKAGPCLVVGQLELAGTIWNPLCLAWRTVASPYRGCPCSPPQPVPGHLHPAQKDIHKKIQHTGKPRNVHLV